MQRWMQSLHDIEWLYFMVTWIIFKYNLLEVGLTQNQDTMAPLILTTINLFYFIMCGDPNDYKFIEIALDEGLVTYDFTLHLRVCDYTT